MDYREQLIVKFVAFLFIRSDVIFIYELILGIVNRVLDLIVFCTILENRLRNYGENKANLH